MSRIRNKRRPIDGILVFDKPAGLTSNAALQKVKQLYAAEKAGHTGSLDPLATGLLPICFGHATKLSGYMLESDKRYRARVRLGARTSTGDAEGAVIATSDPGGIDAARVAAVIPTLLGTIDQVPPMYSAIKRDGQHLYELARQGVEVDRSPRRVTIHELQLLGMTEDGFEFEVLCSKGTYIRTLGEDLMALLLPAETTLVGWPALTVSVDDAVELRHGRGCDAGPLPDEGPFAVYRTDGMLLCLGSPDATGRLFSRRWLGADVLGATSTVL